MNSIKMFGLAALAALLAMAFVGASSAMAEPTTLCKKDETPCPTKQVVTHVHESTLAGAQATLKTSILTVKCDVLFLSSKSNTGSNPLIVTGNFTYSNCNNSCVATEENGPSEIKVLKEGHETAKVTGEGLVHLECGSFIDCLYNGEGLIGTGKGPLLAATEKTNGEVTLTAQKVKEEGGSFFCPDTSELTITTTPLSPTYTVANKAMDCIARVGGLYTTDGGSTCSGDVALEKTGSFELVG